MSRKILIGIIALLILVIGFQTFTNEANSENRTETAVESQISANALSASEAIGYVGSKRTVCGNVVSANYASGSKGKPTFLNLDKNYPNQIFTILIWGDNRSNFPEAPEIFYRNQKVCASGLIEAYKGVPQIEAITSTQVKIVDR